MVGLTRRQAKADALTALGARGVVVDALDRDAVRRAVLDAAPEAVIDELTSLPQDYDLRDPHLYDANDEIRSKGTPALHDAAREAGDTALRHSVDRVPLRAGGRLGEGRGRAHVARRAAAVRAQREASCDDNEQRIVNDPDVEGVVLRYGFLYGPGTYYASNGSIAQQVRKRRFPIVGKGEGRSSYVHLHDAASATVAALDRGRGIYNIVDDEPALLRDWLPVYAQAIGAKKPRRVPAWLARMVAGGSVGRDGDAAARRVQRQAQRPTWAGSRRCRAGARASRRRSIKRARARAGLAWAEGRQCSVRALAACAAWPGRRGRG